MKKLLVAFLSVAPSLAFAAPEVSSIKISNGIRLSCDLFYNIVRYCMRM